MDDENRQAAQGERGRTDRAPRSSQSRQSSMIARSTGEETYSWMPAHNLGTSAPMTNGDNAGVGLGVASGMVMGPSRSVQVIRSSA